MTPTEIRDARAVLGQMWGLNRPLYASEMARVLKLKGRDPGLAVLCWERGKHPISGPVSVAVGMMLRGYPPLSLDDVFTGAAARLEGLGATARRGKAAWARRKAGVI